MSDNQDPCLPQALAELETLRQRVRELEAAGSEARTLEALLWQSQEELRAIYDGMVDGLLIADVETKRFVRANAAICRMLGYSGKELLALSVMDIHPPNDVPEVLAHFQAQAERRLKISENRPVLRKDGSIFYADIASNQVTYHGRVCLIGVFRDITERKQAQEALQASEERLRVIYDGIIEGLLITDIATKQFLHVNASLCKMLGYTKEELLAASIKDIHPPEELANDLLRFEAAAAGRCSINEDRPVLRKDGTIFYADISGHRILYNGRPSLLALFRDVTERRQVQAIQERERRTLEHLLRASDHERQLIAYDIHDGLAQQLAGALMQFQVFAHLKDTKPCDAQKAFEAGATMLRQSHFEARRLISGIRPPILDESGITAAIAHLVHDLGTYRPQIEFQSRVTFHRLTPILENIIYRIAQEALTNACKHSRSEAVKVSLTQDKDLVYLEVCDWGIGFDVTAVGEDRFGLEGIRERVRLLGGQLSVESKAGEGTCIRVTLPILEHD